MICSFFVVIILVDPLTDTVWETVDATFIVFVVLVLSVTVVATDVSFVALTCMGLSTSDMSLLGVLADSKISLVMELGS